MSLKTFIELFVGLSATLLVGVLLFNTVRSHSNREKYSGPPPTASLQDVIANMPASQRTIPSRTTAARAPYPTGAQPNKTTQNTGGVASTTQQGLMSLAAGSTTLATIRAIIEDYHTAHGSYPDTATDPKFAAQFTGQITYKTNPGGANGYSLCIDEDTLLQCVTSSVPGVVFTFPKSSIDPSLLTYSNGGTWSVAGKDGAQESLALGLPPMWFKNATGDGIDLRGKTANDTAVILARITVRAVKKDPRVNFTDMVAQLRAAYDSRTHISDMRPLTIPPGIPAYQLVGTYSNGSQMFTMYELILERTTGYQVLDIFEDLGMNPRLQELVKAVASHISVQ